ncbi:sigma-70 family RNA polymerase sigma factor [Sinomonas sp. G460-2]|uniref:sigma-70 family RNA polymerase sigma factor n=1 Tax=Sinomonas sp. G460-2 TaxID=3393464 RepID=UPI0039F0E9DF
MTSVREELAAPPRTAPRDAESLPADPAPRVAELGDRSSESASPETAARAKAAGDLAVEYLGVADALAKRFRCPGHDPDDLRQVARLGLIKAANRYRHDQGHGFVPYAVPTITGELKRYLRDQSWVVRPPRGIQELRLKINALRPRLAQCLGHEPSTRELSLELSMPVEDVAEAQIADASMVANPIEHADTSDDPVERRLNVVVAAEDPGYERVESMQALADALEGASEAEYHLLHLRFVRELTQDEIARELGVSQMQVSRLLRRLLGRLRRRMAA